MSKRWLAASCLVLITLVATSCLPARTSKEKEFGDNTVMGRIQARGKMIVGIESDLAPYSRFDSRTGKAEGFVVDLATTVADALGVKASFVGATGSQLVSMADNEEVDLAFPAIPITEEFLRNYRLTQVVYVAHQRLLVRSGSGITDVSALGARRTCSFINVDTQVPLKQLVEDVKVVQSARQECAYLLATGQVDAVTGSDVDLMSIATQVPDVEIVGDELTTEGYGAVTSSGGMTDFVNNTFSKVKSDGRWLAYYERWLAPVANAPDRQPPDLRAEEAAALYPSDLD